MSGICLKVQKYIHAIDKTNNFADDDDDDDDNSNNNNNNNNNNYNNSNNFIINFSNLGCFDSISWTKTGGRTPQDRGG